MNTKNKYIIVTNDSDSDYARMISQNILVYLQKNLSDSDCYTYEDICLYYDSFTDEGEKIAQFLDRFDCKIGFQNIFWLFFITSNSGDTVATHWNQQIWVRAGKIIGQFSLRSNNWKNQVSFWELAEIDTTALNYFILDGTYKAFSPDYERVYQYVAGVERKKYHLSSVIVEDALKIFNKEIPIGFMNKEDRTLRYYEFDTISFPSEYQEIFLGQYKGYIESITITRNEIGKIVLTANISEILIRNEEKDGGT